MRKTILAAILLALSLAHAAGQDFETGYFLDGYTYAYRMNPALQCERGFFAIPVAGKLDLAVNSSMKVSDFLYKRNGETVTFLHPDVSKEDFLRTVSRAGEQGAIRLDAPAFALGFWTGKAFHTLDINVRGNISTRMPADLFRFLKNGTEDATAFDFSNLALFGTLLGEVAYGYSRHISDDLTFGFRIKGLAGFAKAALQFDRLRMELASDKWTVQSQGRLRVTDDKLRFETKSSETDPSAKILDITEFDLVSDDPLDLIQPSGFGAAADLGVTWTPLPFLTLSASLLDLGAIRWEHLMLARTPDNSFVYEPADNIPVGEGAGDAISEQFRKAFSGFERITELRDDGSGAVMEMMPFTLRAGAEARLPFYNRLSFGLLGTYVNDPVIPAVRSRLSVNWAPLNWLSMSMSGAVDNYKTASLGLGLNLHTGFLTFFLGSDHLFRKAYRIPDLDWQEVVRDIPFLKSFEPGIPDTMNAALTFGLTVTIGHRRLDYAGRSVQRKDKESDTLNMLEY